MKPPRLPLVARIPVPVVVLLAALVGACASTAMRAPLEPPVRVLVLGDSISMGYTPDLARELGDEYVVRRPMNAADTHAANCAGTNHGIEHVDEWLAIDGAGWDVIHFNFGLHDLKRVDPETGKNSNDPSDPRQAEPERYREQLAAITDRLAATGARLVFATTTPVPDAPVRPHREPGDAILYNRIAREVMGPRGVAIDDLFTFALERIDTIQREADVHFTADGSAQLAAAVASSIRAAAGRAPGEPWRALVAPGSLEGWSAIGGGEWKWRGYALTGTSSKDEPRHGLLVSDARFGDFEARVEFRVLEGDSGFYFRVDRTDDLAGVAGFQAEVDGTLEAGGLYETGGRGWVVKPDPALMAEAYHPGEWTALRVRAVGGDVEVRVNGHVTARLTDDPGRREGHIALQLHGDQDMHVEFRNLWIR